MTEAQALFRGKPLDPLFSVEEQLKKLGLSEKRIEHIQTEAYRNLCCEAFEDVNYARPVIDYGEPCVAYYEASMPYMDGEKLAHKWEQWHYCPFCGKALLRRIHPDTQQTLD